MKFVRFFLLLIVPLLLFAAVVVSYAVVDGNLGKYLQATP